MSVVRIVVLAFKGTSLFQLSIPVVAFDVTSKPIGLPTYDVQYCAQYSGLIISDQGLPVAISLGPEAVQGVGIIMVSVWKGPEEDVPEAITGALKAVDTRGKLIVGSCLGAFVLGAAGLPAGREATTHWIAHDVFAHHFPDTKFRPDVLYVTNGNIITFTGTAVAFDCCFEMIHQQHGSGIADCITRQLVTPPHRQDRQVQYTKQLVPQLLYIG